MLDRLIRSVKNYRDSLPVSSFFERHVREELTHMLKCWELTEEEKKEKFYEIWFGGCGEHSVKRVAQLHHKLDYALMMLSGSQQPPHWDREPTEEMLEHERQLNQETDEAGVEAVLAIAAALGVDIEIVKEKNDEQDAE